MREEEQNALQKLLDELQEKEVDRLEMRRLDLTEKLYPITVPNAIARTSELTGIPAETLVRACAQTAWHYESLQWHNVLDIVRSFYLALKRIEEQRTGQ
jgi:hypothetical protein